MSPIRERPPIHIAVDGIRASVSRAESVRVIDRVLRAERVPRALISIAFLTRPQIARMNREHIGHSGATDVISFGFQRVLTRDPVVGDIYIAPEVARANARSRGVSVREETVRLLVHGVLHVLGHEHPDGAGRERSAMWKRQEVLVARIAPTLSAR